MRAKITRLSVVSSRLGPHPAWGNPGSHHSLADAEKDVFRGICNRGFWAANRLPGFGARRTKADRH